MNASDLKRGNKVKLVPRLRQVQMVNQNGRTIDVTGLPTQIYTIERVNLNSGTFLLKGLSFWYQHSDFMPAEEPDMYASFYFENLHEGRFWTAVYPVQNEQDAYDLREQLGQPELMGVYPTEQKALDVCHVREQFEGGFAGEKTTRGATLVLAASGHKQSAETLEHCGVTVMDANNNIKSKVAVFNEFVAQVQKLGDSNG